MKQIYLDNGATTKLDEFALNSMLPFFTAKYGNASSGHSFGIEAKSAIEESRDIIAKALNTKSDNIIFTSGGTESNNLAIKSIAFSNKEKNHIITTKIEHDCILNSCRWLETQGFNITYLDVDEFGFVSTKDLENAITDKTILFSLIHGNNEIGTIQDLKSHYEICKNHNVIFHTDACQSFTKTPLSSDDADLITLNAHKIHGPKGVGALYINPKLKLSAWQHGGGQEFNLRSGTYNTPGIIGFGSAVKISKKDNQMIELHNYFIDELLKIPNTKLNGPRNNRLVNNINISFEGVDSQTLGDYLSSKGIACSKGSACSTKKTEPSHVLKAIGLSDDLANSTIRFTISKFTTKEELDYTLEVVKTFVSKIRNPGFLDKIIKKFS